MRLLVLIGMAFCCACGALRAGETPLFPPELDALLKTKADPWPLGRAALLLSKLEYPESDTAALEKQLEELRSALRVKLRDAGTVEGKLATLAEFLFVEQGFQLPEKDAAAAFMLGKVLENKRGNCLGLSVLALALTDSLPLKLHGVPVPSRASGPGHLLVRYDDGNLRVNFDPVEGGRQHPDTHYQKLFDLKEADLRDGFILGNATPRDVFAVLLVNLAGARVDEGRAQAALPLLQTALEIRPGYPQALNNLGAAHLVAGDAAEARAAYAKVLARDPRFEPARLGEINALLMLGDLTPAKEKLELFLMEAPDSKQGRVLRANLFMANQEYARAQALLKELSDEFPKDSALRCHVGKASMAAGDLAGAEHVYRLVLLTEPEHADALAGLGDVLAALGKTREAEEAFQQALKANPTHPAARTGLDRLHGKAAQTPEAALEAWRAALKQDPGNAEAAAGLLQALLELKQPREALREAQAQAKRHPKNALLLALLGDAQYGSGQSRDALTSYDAAYKVAQPGNERNAIVRRIVKTYFTLKDLRQTLHLAEKFLQAQADDPEMLWLAGQAAEGLRLTPKAREYYQRLDRVAPGRQEVQEALRRVGAKK